MTESNDLNDPFRLQRGPAPMSYPQGGGGGNSRYDSKLTTDTARVLTALTENVARLTKVVEQDVDNLMRLQSRSFQQESHLKSVAADQLATNRRLDDLSWRTVLMFGWSVGNTLSILYMAVNS